MTMETHNAKGIVQQLYSSLNEKDRESFMNLITDDCTLYEPNKEIRGVDAIVDNQWGNLETFPDLEYTIEDVLAEEDRVAARVTIKGTHKGEFNEIPPTDETFLIGGVYIFRLKNEKIDEIWLNIDVRGLYQQLGVEAPTV